jgi:hypothetical protein
VFLLESVLDGFARACLLMIGIFLGTGAVLALGRGLVWLVAGV